MNNYTEKKIRILLIGFGEMGKSHFKSLLETSQTQVVGVVRLNKEESSIDLPIFSSLEQALSKLHPNLAIISTPHHAHYDQTKVCLENDCNVLVEKPMTLLYSHAESLVRLAEEKDRLLVVGLQRRYEGFATIFRRMMESGKLGDIRLIHGLFSHRFSDQELSAWRSDPQKAGAGIIDDSALHLLDILLYFAGGIAQDLQARILCEKNGMPHSFTCFFNTDQGNTVSACGTYLSPAYSVQEEISIWGTKGSLFGRRFCKDWNIDPPQVFYKSADGSSQEEFDLLPLRKGRDLPLKTLLDVLIGEAPRTALLTEAKNTLETHRVIELIKNAQKYIF